MWRAAIVFLLGAVVACGGGGGGGARRDTAADREALAKLAALRDRACACQAKACYDELTRELDMGVGSLGPHASQALVDAASAMIDELMGCGRRLAIDPSPE